MNGTGMKRITLRFLLVCNLVLLAVIAVFAIRGAMRISEQGQQTAALLESRGVSLSGNAYRALLQEKRAYTLRTDVDAQEQFCRSMLGTDLESRASSGGSICWESDRGSVTWEIEGTVSGTADLSEYGTATDEQSAERMVSERLRAAGVNLRQTAMEAVENDGVLTVRVQEGISGRNLSGCELRFDLKEDGTVTISGQWCLGEPEPVELEALNESTPADILLALLRVHSNVTQVTAVQQVYVLTNRSGGRFTIHPCWKLTTDQGDFLMDPLTGEEVSEDAVRKPTDTTATLPADDGANATEPVQTVPGSDDTTVIEPANPDTDSDDTPVISGDDNWDPTQGTDKTDPELPDENGVYG